MLVCREPGHVAKVVKWWWSPGLYPVLTAIDSALQQQGLRVMILLRFSPIVPYNVFNYVAGVTAVSLGDYTLGCVGMLPGVVVFVYFGTLVTSAQDAASSASSTPVWLRWLLIGVGVVASVAAICIVTAYSRRELKRVVAGQRGATTGSSMYGMHSSGGPSLSGNGTGDPGSGSSRGRTQGQAGSLSLREASVAVGVSLPMGHLQVRAAEGSHGLPGGGGGGAA